MEKIHPLAINTQELSAGDDDGDEGDDGDDDDEDDGE